MESAENQEQPTLGQESAANPNPPLSKTETIALLNDSIDRLEETIKRISEDSAQVPSSQSINTLLSSTQELEAAVSLTEAKVSQAAAAATASQPPVIPPTPSETIASQDADSQDADDQDTESQDVKAKTVMPAPAKPKKIGLIIAAVLAIAIVVGLWFWQPPQLVQLLPQTKAESILSEPNSLPEQPNVENLEQEEASDSDLVNVVPQDFPAEIESIDQPETDIVETIIPEELTSPGKAKNLKVVAIKPKLNFSPEQNLLAALDTKLSELVQAYPRETVAEIRPNLTENSLSVEVTEGWYSLDESEQNSLGQSILERSRAFGFDKLELKDQAGTLVARNPIIGDRIIVLYSEIKDVPE